MKRLEFFARAVSAYASFWAGQNNNLESALEAAKKAVELTPDAYNSWNILSQINLKLKKYDDALKAIEKAVETAPQRSTEEYLPQADRPDQSRSGKEINHRHRGQGLTGPRCSLSL